ncbi:MAG: glutamate-5-semialdehyde dehydrogenase [Oscillospiraceae bacterium]|nr:glutamate-5-semialdehyde dehydrogenase [Oscillospiraceae bacterium]
MDHLHELARQAKEAAGKLALYDTATKNRGLEAIALALEARQSEILEANDRDMAQAEQSGMRPAMLDRLRLTPERIAGMAKGVREVMALPDPVGEIMDTVVRPNGLNIRKVRVPLGVVGIIYEARPNVTVDAAVLCLKSGNAAFLRGGKEAFGTNLVLAGIMKDALAQAGLDSDCITFLDDTSHATADAMMRLRGFIDVLIPRGGAGLIRRVLETATIPTIETGTGNCHLYVDKSADLDMAVEILFNGKCSRPSVCNALETVLVHEAVAERFLPAAYARLEACHVEWRGCERTRAILPGITAATEEDYVQEFNDYILAARVVDSLDQALAHIARYTTHHSEAIVTADPTAAERFLREVDAAAVYVNASTRFTDGGEFGCGAEIGISTQKMHARGPMGLRELTSYKYVVQGNGQVR